MTKRERNILFVALAVGVVLLGTRVLPLVQGIYAERTASIESIRLDIERERRLLDNAERWQQQRLDAEQLEDTLATQVFQGDALPLISANIQRMVRDHAASSGIAVTSTGLSEPLQVDDWLLVQQELSFQTSDQRNLIAFLQALDESTPWLGVSAFSVRRNRNQYAGDITVVGFSRTETGNAMSQGE